MLGIHANLVIGRCIITTATSPTSTQADRVTLRHGGLWVLTSTILGSSMVWLNSSALNVALDAIQRELDATATQLLWIVNIYLLFLAAFILIGGAMGDRFGRNRVFGAGVAIFTLASIACGLAPNTELLIILRAVQGFGGAMLVPGSLAIITATFARNGRAQAIGIWASASAVTTLLGPPVGGFLTDIGLWRGIFLMSVPLAIIVLLALRRVPETRDKDAPEHLDYRGAVVLAVSLAALTFGALQLGETTAVNQQLLVAVGTIIVGVALFVGFILLEQRTDHPMLELALFRSRTFSAANLVTMFLYAALSAAFIFIPLNLIQIQGYSETLAGFASLPLPLAIAILSPVMGQIAGRIGPRLPMSAGPALTAVGYLVLALPGVTAGETAYWVTFFPGIVLAGLGMGITVTPLTNTVMSAAPETKTGTASGINNAVSRTAQTLATGFLGAVMIFVFSTALHARTTDLSLSSEAETTLQQEASRLGNAEPPETLSTEVAASVEQAIDLAFVDGFRTVFFLAALLAGISAVISLVFIPSDNESIAPEQAESE